VDLFLFLVASTVFVESMQHGISDASLLFLFLLFDGAAQGT
jgi:hypothetical protein